MIVLLLIILGLIGAALVALSVGPLRRLNLMSPRVWWLLVALCLTRFWVMDLYAARFQVVLLLIPAGIAIGHAIWRSVLGRLSGGIGSLSVIWVLMFRRMQGTCCSGVSDAFYETLTILLGLLLLAAPLAVGFVLSRSSPELERLAEVFD